MRLTLSKGKVNIYSLAKNAGTNVDQIERFYARNLPLPTELVQSAKLWKRLIVVRTLVAR
jgi:hypothetical protein